MKKKVMCCIPSGPTIHVGYQLALQKAIQTSQTAHVEVVYQVGDSLVERARQGLLRTFVMSDAEYMCSIDTDIQIGNTTADNNIFDLLLGDLSIPGVDFVGGVYSVKSASGRPSSVPVYPLTWLNDNLLEMRWLSTGCWMLSRKVVTSMIDKYSDLCYRMDGSKDVTWALYLPMLVDVEENGEKWKKLLSEDWAFCERWRAMGGKIYADNRIHLIHWGLYPYRLASQQQEGKEDKHE